MAERPHSTNSIRSLDGFLLVLWTCLICSNVPNSFLLCCGQYFASTSSANILSDLWGLKADFKTKLENSAVIISYAFCLNKHFKDGIRIILCRNHRSCFTLKRKIIYNFLFMHCTSAGRPLVLFYQLLQHKSIHINSHFFSVYYNICIYRHLFIMTVKNFKTLKNPCIPTWQNTEIFIFLSKFDVCFLLLPTTSI